MATVYSNRTKPSTTYTNRTKPTNTTMSMSYILPLGLLLSITREVMSSTTTSSPTYTNRTKPTTTYTNRVKP